MCTVSVQFNSVLFLYHKHKIPNTVTFKGFICSVITLQQYIETPTITLGDNGRKNCTSAAMQNKTFSCFLAVDWLLSDGGRIESQRFAISF